VEKVDGPHGGKALRHVAHHQLELRVRPRLHDEARHRRRARQPRCSVRLLPETLGRRAAVRANGDRLAGGSDGSSDGSSDGGSDSGSDGGSDGDLGLARGEVAVEVLEEVDAAAGRVPRRRRARAKRHFHSAPERGPCRVGGVGVRP